MNLTQEPEVVNWPETHYVFVEKAGTFQETAPKAWQELQKVIPKISESNKVNGFMALYKRGPKLYRAGMSVGEAPRNLPEGMQYEKFAGGKYSKFVLTGSYANLPQASGRVFELVEEKKIRVRDDFCIENYVNDPRNTPEDQLVTQILIPTA